MPTVTKDISVQDVVVKTVTFSFGDLNEDTAYEVIDIPPNSVILSGSFFTTVAWNSTTSDVIDLGDSGSATRYASNLNIRAANALNAITPTGYVSPGGPLTVTWTAGTADTATTGTVRLIVEYVTLGKADATYSY
jgi:hypothetical protein